MRRRPFAIIVLLILGLGVAFTIGQTTTPVTDLLKWTGKQCRVYLKVESDPRIGRTTFTGGGPPDDGILSWEGIPISVTGTVANYGGNYLVLSTKNGTVWIPHAEVRVIQFYDQSK
jgi:hypothetical protein